MEISKDIFTLAIYSIPGLVANSCRFAITDRIDRKDELSRKLQFVFWSIVSWVIIYHLSRYLNRLDLGMNLKVQPVMLSQNELLSNWFSYLVVLIGVIVGLFVGLCDNIRMSSRVFNPVRKWFGKKPEDPQELWTRLFVGGKACYVEVDGIVNRLIKGVVRTSSGRDEANCLYIAELPESCDIDRIPSYEGTYVNLEKGYAVRVFRDSSEIVARRTELTSRVFTGVTETFALLYLLIWISDNRAVWPEIMAYVVAMALLIDIVRSVFNVVKGIRGDKNRK